MARFFRRFIKLLKSILPLELFFIVFVCLICIYYDKNYFDAFTMAFVILAGLLIFTLAAAAGAFGDTQEKEPMADNAEKGCFKGLSKASRLFSKGKEALEQHQLNEALSIFQDVEEMDISRRERAILCLYIGNCYRFMGYPTNAAKYYGLAIENKIDSDNVYVLAARCCVANGSFSDAMEYYNQLISRGAFFDYIYTDMGMCCLKNNDPEGALEYFTKSIEEHKNYAFSLGGCSLAYLMKKDIEKSREFYSKALINNLGDVSGFRKYYRSVAEASGCLELIEEFMKPDKEEAAPEENIFSR